MLRHVVTVIALFLSTQAIAQTWYPGRYVNNEGDTISGFIELKEDDRNPTWLKFKQTSESESVTTLLMKDVRFFAYSFGDQYTKFDVSVSVDPIELKFARLTLQKPEFRPVFLKRIAHGKSVTLFSYTDDIKKRFYIFAPGYSKPLELGYAVMRNGQSLSENFAFRETLISVAETAGTLTKQLRSEIRRAQYKDFHLIPIVNQINSQPRFVDEGPKRGHSFNVGAGVVFGKYVFYPGTYAGEQGSGSFNPGPSVSIGYDMATNPRVGRLIFRARLQYSIVKYEGNTSDGRFISSDLYMKHQFTQKNFSFGILAAYNVINTERFKLYLSTGAMAFTAKYDYKFIKSSSPTAPTGPASSTTKRAEPRPGWINAPISLGVVLHNRFEITAAYWRKVPLHDQLFQEYSYGAAMFETGVKYHLPIKR